MPERRCRHDGGFTLVELLISVAVMGLLFTSLSAGIVAVLRNMDTTTRRITETTDAQNLVTWLPVDISSSPAANLSTDPTLPSGCSSPSPGISVLLLGWSESINGTTTAYAADYRAVPEGDGIRLQRFSCSGIGSLGAARVLNVSNKLPALPAGWGPGQAPLAVSVSGIIVTFTLTQADGRVVRVESSQKNPAATLPPPPTTATPAATSSTAAPTTSTTTTTTIATGTTTTGPATTSTSTTTSTTTTTTIPCVVTSVTASPSSVNTHSQAPNQLQEDVIVTITQSGPCQLVQLQYDTGGSQGLLYQNFPSSGPFTVTLRGFKSGGTEIWTAGQHVLAVIDNNKVVLNSTTLTVS